MQIIFTTLRSKYATRPSCSNPSEHFNTTKFMYSHFRWNLKILGFVPSGLNILKNVKIHVPFGEIFVDTLPLTLISYMEVRLHFLLIGYPKYS